jgi:hypothetical protein
MARERTAPVLEPHQIHAFKKAAELFKTLIGSAEFDCASAPSVGSLVSKNNRA